jgi:hypothetical protein
VYLLRASGWCAIYRHFVDVCGCENEGACETDEQLFANQKNYDAGEVRIGFVGCKEKGCGGANGEIKDADGADAGSY